MGREYYMIEVVETKNKKRFIFDNSIVNEKNDILRGSFVMLFANKIILKSKDGKESISYEYPTNVFENMNMCKVSNIEKRRIANELENRLYNGLRNNMSLSDDIRKLLRNNYLNIIHVDNMENKDK